MTRPLRPLPLPAGPDVLAAMPLLTEALAGRGPALLPIPAGAALPTALRPGDPLGEDEDDPADPTALVVPTSGSTGEAKGVLLSMHALRASARATEQRLGGPGHWMLALPPWHIAGLQVLLRTIGGNPPLVLPAGPFRPETFAAGAAAMPATGRRYVSLVPTQLHRVLADPPATAALRTFDAVLVGGAATPGALLAAARRAGVAVITTYGMTETCGGCVYDGQPLDGVTVALDDAGRIVLGGSVVGRGYRCRPDDPAFAARRRFVTGDLGAWSDGRLEVLGRADDVIVTGGLKVAPHRVEAAVAALAGVGAVVVVGVPDEQWGEAVTAVVAPSGIGFDPDAARRLPELASHQRPRRVLLTDAIPELGSGKPDRRAVRDWAIRQRALEDRAVEDRAVEDRAPRPGPEATGR